MNARTSANSASALVASVFFMLCAANIVSATFIGVTTTLSTDTMNVDKTTVMVEIESTGDETAYGARIGVSGSGYFQSVPLQMGDLQPNSTYKGNFTVSLKPGVAQSAMPGRYMVPVLVEYADTNGYPFSSMASAVIIFKQDSSSDVIATVTDATLPLSGKADVKIELKNLDDSPHAVKVGLHLPKELKLGDGTSGTKEVTVLGKGETTLSFGIENLAVVGDSTYNAMIITDYDDGGIHYSSSSNSVITVTAKETPDTTTVAPGGIGMPDLGLGVLSSLPLYLVLVLVAIALVLVYIYYKVKK